MDVSVVVPIFNEVESIPLLVEKLHTNLAPLGRTYEIVLIDDGPRFKLIHGDQNRELLAAFKELAGQGMQIGGDQPSGKWSFDHQAGLMFTQRIKLFTQGLDLFFFNEPLHLVGCYRLLAAQFSHLQLSLRLLDLRA